MDSTDEPHVRLSLGLYLLGAVDAAERATIERHLATCDACRAESDELAATVAAVALIPDDDRRSIVAEFGIPGPAPSRSQPPSTPQSPESEVAPAPKVPAAQAPAPDRPVPTVTPPVPPGPVPGNPVALDDQAAPGTSTEVAPESAGAGAGDVVPGSRRRRTALPFVRPGSGPRPVRPGRSRPRRRTRGLVGIGSLVVVVLASAGIFVGLAVDGGRPDPPRRTAISLAATAATTTGATLSAVAVAHGDGITVRASVSGLRSDTHYQLYVVAASGATHVVATWAGSSRPREITGEAPLAVSDLVFFTVARADGTPVVSAAVPR
ncbi:hypothetical protein GCM10022220_44790 [Actinocatenispora rupis]|uniref:Putative zinc-finger domain-containing protein n=1 Tax=Actinocatenispora rupis TaxID=519421 RepID=A0A8J3JAS6_9ACTN|nr:hypothetical protein Aru02nite_58990 [Actinocatenispora rupis]